MEEVASFRVYENELGYVIGVLNYDRFKDSNTLILIDFKKGEIIYSEKTKYTKYDDTLKAKTYRIIEDLNLEKEKLSIAKRW